MRYVAKNIKQLAIIRFFTAGGVLKYGFIVSIFVMIISVVYLRAL